MFVDRGRHNTGEITLDQRQIRPNSKAPIVGLCESLLRSNGVWHAGYKDQREIMGDVLLPKDVHTEPEGSRRSSMFGLATGIIVGCSTRARASSTPSAWAKM